MTGMAPAAAPRNDELHLDGRAELTLRTPALEDGAAVWELIGNCEPLDENSMYCNFLQCDHFAETCVVAELDGRTVGWVSGYIVPNEPEALFIWQVAVDEAARGLGLGKAMLRHLVDRKVCAGITQLKTTITRDNRASWALFSALAEERDARLGHEAHLKHDEHFDGKHPTEYLVTIAELRDEPAAAA